jgi:ribonuclease E
MLIDASHPEETRVVVLDGNRVEEFDFESASKRPLKGNIYLAKVTRVEPSLQAAFVEYGGNRQGFLAFSEIHPDYYQIPVADRMAILEAQTRRMMAEDDFDAVDTGTAPAQQTRLGGEDADEHAEQRADAAASEAADEQDEPEERLDHDDSAAASSSESRAAPSENSESESDEAPAHEVADTVPSESGAAEDASEDVSRRSAETQPGESSREPVTVQTEATGAPVTHQRFGPRPNDRSRPPRRRQYKIQEVIKRRQIMLVQVVKEERGNKGASLTTFLSLAGRYCVLMPNTPRGGGISRKITNAADRKRLKGAAQSLELPEGMGLIIRTAGANRTKLEIKRDYEYLLRLWDSVRELTLQSNAPALVYEEGSLIKRVIRDLYSKDISEVVVDGESGYREAKEFMRTLMPSHAKNVKLYKEPLPLFQSFHVEAQLDAMFSPVVQLRSGGYIVINQTEALVSIDVNSGKATREHSIEDTAYKTNLEASDEIARQLRLRDLAGLIVIDYIDMEDSKNDRNVEKRLHNAVKGDRARIQIGKISQFGLLEMSRQRLRPGVLASSTITCPHCNGQGLIRSTESAALRLLRALDEEGQRQPSANLTVKAPSDVTIYTLNQKRREIARIEEAYDLAISFDPQSNIMGGSFELERTGVRVPSARPKPVSVSPEAVFEEIEPEETDVTIVEPPAEAAPHTQSSAQHQGESGEGNGEGRGRKRRRRRRNGKRPQAPLLAGDTEPHRGEPPTGHEPAAQMRGEHLAGESEGEQFEGEAETDQPGETSEASSRPAAPNGQSAEAEKRRRRRRRGRRGRRREGELGAPPTGAGNIGGNREPSHAEAGASDTARSEDQPPAAPNAPSSPLWSLTDQDQRPKLPVAASEYTAAHPSREEHYAATAQADTPSLLEQVDKVLLISDELEPLPDSSQPEQPELPQAAATQPETRGESRKGWWQRRFKA